jgi:hypothetical protein
MRAARALRPAMIRGILQAIAVFFLLRMVFWFLRLVSAGSRSPVDADPGRPSGREGAPRRKPLRVDRSNVTDVPFTEIPAGSGTADPRPEAKPAERVEAR